MYAKNSKKLVRHSMEHSGIVFAFFLIFFGSAVMATAALFTRQSMLVAYILVGAIVGPWGLKLISSTNTVSETAEVGIMFLLFLLGLNLKPSALVNMLKGATIITLVSSLSFMAVSLLVCKIFGFSWLDSVIVGVAMMFSSTIIGLKLLPTTVLHHQRIGEIVVSVLLAQDILAIIVLLVINLWSGSHGNFNWWAIGKTIVGMPALISVGYFVERYVLHFLFKKFSRINEYVFLMAIAWCLGMSELANLFGLSVEIGAFAGGVSLAASPISQYIAESLKPLRDFFLVVFFFSIGAGFNFHYLPEVLFPVLIIALIILIFKPIMYRLLLRSVDGEKTGKAWEIGVRLGQASEFSMLVAFLSFQEKLISQDAYITIQAVTLLTFIVSSYAIVLRYPSPMAMNPKLRRD